MRPFTKGISALAALGCAMPLLITLSLVGLLGAGAAAASWPALSGLLPDPGGFMLPAGHDLLADSSSFPSWGLPCGPEPGGLALDPSLCTGDPQPFPFSYQGFATGQCTWYVATRRRVTWHTAAGLLGGDAGQWLGLAAQAGYSVGPAPELGAIAVYSDSGDGHVAFVVGVDAEGDYTVAESNWTLLGPVPPYVDLRGVAAGTTGSAAERLAGFIYGRAAVPAAA
ncbi:MAG: CHAP domain-containing protein [Candidatus Dormibacteria bacterium]